MESAVRVSAADGLQAFLRDKLLISVYNSLSHRKTALSDATELTDTIIKTLLTLQAKGVIEKRLIVKTTLEILQHFDSAAAIHYQAHH